MHLWNMLQTFSWEVKNNSRYLRTTCELSEYNNRDRELHFELAKEIIKNSNAAHSASNAFAATTGPEKVKMAWPLLFCIMPPIPATSCFPFNFQEPSTKPTRIVSDCRSALICNDSDFRERHWAHGINKPPRCRGFCKKTSCKPPLSWTVLDQICNVIYCILHVLEYKVVS